MKTRPTSSSRPLLEAIAHAAPKPTGARRGRPTRSGFVLAAVIVDRHPVAEQADDEEVGRDLVEAKALLDELT
jgi:hypothetical protein